MLTIILIALGLNFDTFSVAVIGGAQANKLTFKQIVKVGLIFGIVQGFMAFGGMGLGIGFKFIIANIDHWVAFILLELIGIKMILEMKDENSKNQKINFLDTRTQILLAVATSIDSLVIGITFAFLNVTIIISIFIIGVVTFLISSVGFYAGKKLRGIFKNKIKLAGGLILMLIGLKILVEHLN